MRKKKSINQVLVENPVRLSVNINLVTADSLRRLTSVAGISVTEAVRRAVAITSYLEGERANGRQILSSNFKGTKVKEVIFN